MVPGLGRRFMRLHANKSRGMYLCNHGIWRIAHPRLAVPADAPPLDQEGNKWWPPGWGRLCSRDIASLFCAFGVRLFVYPVGETY